MRIVHLPLMMSLCSVLLLACAAPRPMPAVPQLDLGRFMGDWYVIATIPSPIERNAYNAVESYSLLPDGRIQTKYRQRKGSFDGKLTTMEPVGTVRPGTGNAVWGMQFIWPIKAEYVVAWLDADYQHVIIGRSKRDYVWVMSRSPTVGEAQYREFEERVAALGYDTAKLRRTPQQWPEP